MPLAKFNRKKIIHWLSPLLILSLGIHGLVLLVPIPEKSDLVEEPDPELLEPIQVSTLPPLPEAATDQPPIAILPENSEPVVPEPAQTAQPVPAAAQPAPQNTPNPQPLPTSTMPAPATMPITKPSKPPPATPQPYSAAGTTAAEARNAVIAFGSTYGALPKNVDTPLALTYPAERRCFDPASLEASMAVAVNNGGGVIGGKVVKNSGSTVVDEWIEDTLLGLELPSYAFADPANASGKTIADWIYETSVQPAGEPLVPAGVNQAAYLINVTVTVEDNNC